MARMNDNQWTKLIIKCITWVPFVDELGRFIYKSTCFNMAEANSGSKKLET